MAGFVKPTNMAILNYLQMLFGDDVKVDKGTSVAPAKGFIGTFVDDEGQVVGGCVADINFAAYAGAAMSMLPKGAADDAIKSKDVTEVMTGNLGEVFNILSRVVMDEGSDHLRYREVLSPEADADVAGTLKALSENAFAISIPKYGKGQLSIYIK